MDTPGRKKDESGGAEKIAASEQGEEIRPCLKDVAGGKEVGGFLLMRPLIQPATRGPNRQLNSNTGQFFRTAVHFNGSVMTVDYAVTDR